eukprot:m.181591 g.181591  ORF g.181591 m.181591 type:complete len:157 (+) comp16629_c1_seq2:254-724(+)
MSAPYLHGEITKDEATALLAGRSDGTFLIRKRSSPDEFVLSVNFQGQDTHHLLSKNADGYFTINKKAYDLNALTVHEVVEALKGPVKHWPVLLKEFIPASEGSDTPDLIADFPYFHGHINKDTASGIVCPPIQLLQRQRMNRLRFENLIETLILFL